MTVIHTEASHSLDGHPPVAKGRAKSNRIPQTQEVNRHCSIRLDGY